MPAARPPRKAWLQVIWAAVPVKHRILAMLAFHGVAEVLRMLDGAVFSRDGLPRSNHPANPTMRH